MKAAQPSLKIEILPGMLARRLVDPLYEAEGGRSRARDEDLFFLALLDSQLVGCVRFCVENKTPMLRSMMIRNGFRRRGIGEKILAAFAEFLEREGLNDVFCLPYEHLEAFYGRIGFATVEQGEIPKFLAERMTEYNLRPNRVLCMKRALVGDLARREIQNL